MHKLSYISVILFTAISVFAQEHLALPDAVRMALTHNPDIQAAKNSAANAANRAQIGNAGLLPRLTLTAGATYTEETNGAGSAGTQASTAPTAQVQAGYTLFDGFGNIYRFKSLRTAGELGRSEAIRQIESVILQVADGYYRCASSFENFQIAETLVRISNERLQRAKNRSDYGQARTIDVLSARVDLNADSVTLAQASLSRDQAMRSLNLLLFRDVHTTFTVDTAVTIPPDFHTSDLLTRAMENNAVLQSAQLRRRQARYDYNISKTAHLPQLDLSASYGYSQFNPDFDTAFGDPVKTARVGATVTFNLFNGFQAHIQRQNARRTYETQRLMADQAVLALETDLYNAVQAFRTSLSVRDLAGRSLEVAELNFKRTEELYHLGQVTTTQFREAQLNLVRAQSQVSTAKYDAKLSELAILRLTGELVQPESVE